MKENPRKKPNLMTWTTSTPLISPLHSFPTHITQIQMILHKNNLPTLSTHQNIAMKKNQKKHKQKLKHIKPAKMVIWGMSIQTPQEEDGRGVSPGARMAAGTIRHPHHDMPNRVLTLEDEEGTSGDEQEYPSQEVMGGGCCLEVGDGDMDDTVDNGRERLKRHRTEVAGRVWIPEMWGQEEFLKDWVDCTVFDSSLVPSKIMSARAALVEEGRRASSPVLRVGNRC